MEKHISKTKILFTDLDGTLLDDQKNISHKNQEAIQQALLAGHKIVITTGRPLFSTQQLCEKLGLTAQGCYSISFNGGVIYNCYEKRVIYEQTLSFDDVRRLMDEARQVGIHAQTYSASHVLAERASEALDQYASIVHVHQKIVPDVLKELGTKRPAKVLMIGSHDQLEQFRLSTLLWRKEKIDAFFSCSNYLEFVPYGSSKGNAIRILCDLLHIPLSASIAAGDAENDISMIQAAHIGAVMANASDEMKVYGNYITKKDNNHSGIAEIIDRFLLS